ncbi:MAG: lipid-A-disaccharide synthase [Hyphomicrobiales bacterium]|nr:lipid-A-disaccharide synthase [Hyphomicrobiales bacterium]
MKSEAAGAGPHVFMVAGEVSGDQLGFKLMQALRAENAGVVITGVGGPAMVGEGLDSLFPLEDIAVMGFVPLLRRLPLLRARIHQTAQAVIAARPDVLVIIDSPDFTHRVARLVRAALPDLAVVDYVSPSIWAWRPGRAAKMRAYVDSVLALFPFEPEAHRRLGGPPCAYVGHPLIERAAEWQPSAADAVLRAMLPGTLLLLPGSRRSEIERLLPDFCRTLALVAAAVPGLRAVLPAVPQHETTIRAIVGQFPLQPEIITGEAGKWATFRQARAALAASGTVTLELALAKVPMVTAYRVSPPETLLRFMVTAPSIILPNLVRGENFIPEFIQRDATPQKLAAALLPLLADSEARAAQLRGFADVEARMALADARSPSSEAARHILASLRPRLPT